MGAAGTVGITNARKQAQKAAGALNLERSPPRMGKVKPRSANAGAAVRLFVVPGLSIQISLKSISCCIRPGRHSSPRPPTCRPLCQIIKPEIYGQSCKNAGLSVNFTFAQKPSALAEGNGFVIQSTQIHSDSSISSNTMSRKFSPTYFGFLLLAALPHRSLHRRTGRVPPLKH